MSNEQGSEAYTTVPFVTVVTQLSVQNQSEASTSFTSHDSVTETNSGVISVPVKKESYCIDKSICKTINPDTATCLISKFVRTACPISCKTCTHCNDDVKCSSIRKIWIICKHDPEIQKMCPHSCAA